MKNPLLDIDFLKKLDNQTDHEVYAKVIALDFDENPVDEITGKVTQGSINIDGTSAIRRSCSVSLVAQDVNINDFYWGLNTKIKLFVGLRNFVDSQYEDVIWFKQGTYLLTSFSTSYNTSSYTISLSGKDKMCLLNGDLGGNITSLTVDFGTYDEIDADGNILNYDYPLKEIITEAVHQYGKEPYHNIVVSDLDDQGLELMEYRGDVDLFLLIDEESGDVTNIRFDDEETAKINYIKMIKNTDGSYTENGTVKITDQNNMVYNSRITALDFLASIEPTYIKTEDEDTIYSVARITYGQTCGFRLTELVYAGDLIGDIDNSITSAVLDKIVTMLGDYEYFYDVDGIFHFQRKRTYINKSWNNIVNSRDEKYVDSAVYTSAVSYSFTDNNLISSFQNNPDLANLKNDYSIWGVRTSASGTEIPIHLRYAIDDKARYYKSFDGTIYLTEDELLSIYQKQLETLGSNNIRFSSVSTFKRTTTPDGLSEGWWEICDWVRRYLYYADTSGNRTMTYYLGLTITELSELIAAAIPPTSATTEFNNACYRLKVYPLSSFLSSWTAEDWLTIFPRPLDLISSYYDNLEIDEEVYLGMFSTSISSTGTEYISSLDYGYETSQPIGSVPCNLTLIDIFKKITEDIDINYHIYVYEPILPETDNTTDIIEGSILSMNYEIVDWREIIYQMAMDYFKYQHDDNFLATIALNNSDYYPYGTTGYEQYYIDIEGFWRELYNSDIQPIDLSTFNPSDAKVYYIWNNDTGTYTEYTFREATDVADFDDTKTYYYYNGVKTLNSIVSQVQAYQTAVDSATLNLAQNGLSDVVTQYYQNIVNTNQALLDEYDSSNIYQRKQFLSIGDDSELATNLMSAFYPNYYQVSSTRWEEYIPYYNYKDGETYYLYEFVKDLSTLSSKDTYYTKNGDNYVEYTKTVSIEDTTSDVDELGNYTGTKEVPSFKLGDIYYKYTGFEKVSSLETGNNTYYTYGSYQISYTYDSETTYYLMSTLSTGEKVFTETVASSSKFGNNSKYYIKVDSTSSSSATVNGYCKILELKSDETYYARAIINNQLVITTPKYFSRGTTYYYEDGTVAFTFELGVSYYLNKGYTQVLDLSDLNGKNYYLEYGSGLSALEAVDSLVLSKIYYGYIAQDSDSLVNGYYFIKNENTFEQINLLKEYNRGKIYYEYGEGYDLTDNLSDFSQVYYVKIDDDVYKSVEDIVNSYAKTNGILNKIQMTDLINTYGIQVYENGVIYALGQNYDFYLKQNAYRPYNYYIFAFYQAAASYNLATEYYILNGSDYEKQNTVSEEEFLSGENKYYIKLNNDNIKVYLNNEYSVKTINEGNVLTRGENYGWTLNRDTPEMLNFWFDFLDIEDGELAQYSVQAVGDRPKSINDDTVKAIYYRDTPTVIFCGIDGNYIKTFVNSETFNTKDSNGNQRVYYEKDSSGNYYQATKYSANKDYYRLMTSADKQSGYTYVNLSTTVDNLFSISAQGKSAMDMVDNFLYNYSYCTQSITLNTIPIYYLEPNTRIFVHDDNSGIDGEYLIIKLSIPLQYNGMMSISATKAVDRII